MRTLKFITASYFIAAIVFTIYAFTHFPVEKMANLIFDDAYYYLGVAQNIAEGKGSSFGNLVETNGYHPLWLLILSGIIYTFSLPKVWAFAALPILVLSIKAFAVLRVDTRAGTHATAWLIATILVIFLCEDIFSTGLETCLLLAFLPLISQIKEYPENFSPKTCLKYGAIFSLFFLVRLDVLALAGAFALFTIIGRRKYAITNLAMTLALTSVAVVLYFAINYKLFGTIVPVSGQAKALGNKIGENLPVFFDYVVASRLAIGAFVLSTLLRWSLPKSLTKEVPFSFELKLTALATLIVATYYALLSGWPLWGWYFWPVALVTFYAFAQLVHFALIAGKHAFSEIKVKLLIVAAWGFVAYALLLGVRTELTSDANIFYSSLKKENNPTFTVMNIRLINDFFSTAPEGVIAMGDRAGGLGFWLPERFKFFHTEGLVANKEYVNARKEGRGLEFLKGLGIKYFIVERERLLETTLDNGTLIHGIVEPVQGLSVHSGLVLICLPEDAILYKQNYDKQLRYVYDFTKVMDCPADIQQQVNAMSKNYGELRRFSLPTEYEQWSLMKYIKSNPF